MDKRVDIGVSSGNINLLLIFTLITHRLPSVNTNIVSTIFLQMNAEEMVNGRMENRIFLFFFVFFVFFT